MPASTVVPLQDAGLLSAVAAGAVQGLEEFGDGHGWTSCWGDVSDGYFSCAAIGTTSSVGISQICNRL